MRYISIVVFFMLLLTSCDFNKKEKCMALDNNIAAINDSLLRLGSEWGDELQISINTLNFSGLPYIRSQMQDYIARKLKEVKAMENVGGSEKLLETELEFLAVEQEIVLSRLTVFEQFTDSVKMDDLSDAYADMQLSAVKERELLEKLHKLRDEYAEKNNIPKSIERH